MIRDATFGQKSIDYGGENSQLESECYKKERIYLGKYGKSVPNRMESGRFVEKSSRNDSESSRFITEFSRNHKKTSRFTIFTNFDQKRGTDLRKVRPSQDRLKRGSQNRKNVVFVQFIEVTEFPVDHGFVCHQV